jgi:hypothetical protein
MTGCAWLAVIPNVSGRSVPPGVPVLAGRDVHDDDHARPAMVVGNLDLARIDRDREDAALLVLVDDLAARGCPSSEVP